MGGLFMKKIISFLVITFFLFLTTNFLFAADYPHATLTVVKRTVEVEYHNIPVIHSGDIILLELNGFSTFSFVSFIQKDISGGPIERMVENDTVLKVTRQNNLIFIEALPVLEPTMISFGFGGAEFSNRPAPSLIYKNQVVASGLVVMPAVPMCTNQCSSGEKMGTSATTYKTCVIDPNTGCTTWSPVDFFCPYGTVFQDGACTAYPSREKMQVGEWFRITTWRAPIKWLSVLVDPKQWDIKDVKVYSRFDGNFSVVDLASNWSVNYSGIGQECNGFLTNMPGNQSKVYISFFVKPKTNGFLKIQYEFSYGEKERSKGEWIYEGVSNTLPGAPAKNLGTGGKKATTWGGIK